MVKKVEEEMKFFEVIENAMNKILGNQRQIDTSESATVKIFSSGHKTLLENQIKDAEKDIIKGAKAFIIQYNISDQSAFTKAELRTMKIIE